MASDAKPNDGRDGMPIVPNTHEHGVFGYDQNAVGGFGEDYSHQVAQGSEPEAAMDLPSDEKDQALIKAVQKALGHAHVDASELRVEVDAARVMLFGAVNHGFEKSDLEARARAVPGVVSVTSRITARDVGNSSR
jgi:BON domain